MLPCIVSQADKLLAWEDAELDAQNDAMLDFMQETMGSARINDGEREMGIRGSVGNDDQVGSRVFTVDNKLQAGFYKVPDVEV